MAGISSGWNKADHEADAGAPAQTFAAQMVSVLLHLDLAVRPVGYEDGALDLDLLLLHELHQPVEFLRRRVDVLVAGYEHVRRLLCHGQLLRPRLSTGRSGLWH